MKISATDLVSCVTKLVLEKWQQFCKLHIRPTVGCYRQKSSLSRRHKVTINRLRIGHTRCTHSYLLSGADQPECTTCRCPLTVKHILVECTDFNDTRNKHFIASSIEELFKTLDFITETHFHSKLMCCCQIIFKAAVWTCLILF